jgi:tetratricopeptide (TPR) repeat protein
MTEKVFPTNIRWSLVLVVVLCFLGVWAIASDLDRREMRKNGEEDYYQIPAEQLRPFLFGYDLITADLFWLETIQYLGRHLLSDQRFPYLYPRLVRVISMDPHFLDVYRLGALFLAHSAGRVDDAIHLLIRGAALHPDCWEPAHDLGTLYYLRKKDYPQALYWLERANRLPGRPDYVPRFVARLHASTGHKETAIEMWIGIYYQTNLSWVRDIARRELGKLGVHLPPETER